MVNIKIIKTEDESLTAAIIKANNSQTVVESYQLASLREIHTKIEEYFNAQNNFVYYERRKNQPTQSNKRKITLPDLGRIYLSIHKEVPHQMKSGGDRYLHKYIENSNVFNDNHKLEDYFKVALLASLTRKHLIISQTAEFHVMLLLYKYLKFKEKYTEDFLLSEFSEDTLIHQAIKNIENVINNHSDTYKKKGFYTAKITEALLSLWKNAYESE